MKAVVFEGGGVIFLPCTKSEGGKILRDTKGTN